MSDTKTIKPDKLADTLKESLAKWVEVTEEAAQIGVRETANELLPDLQNANPNPEPYRSWKKYNSGWKVSLLVKRGKAYVSYVLHNAKEYQLTHLLEYGHAVRGGGRAAAFPHIQPVADRAEDLLFDNIIKNVRGGQNG